MAKFFSGQIFHVFNKSIANFGIFKDEFNTDRFIKTLEYYNNSSKKQSFSDLLRRKQYKYNNLLAFNTNNIVKYISFCIMPDHYHLLIKVVENHILSKYINDVENSFTRYFNIKFKRKGPLWETGFKKVQILNNEQLLHVSRYIHLNPTTSNLISNPEDWKFSSYKDIISNNYFLKNILTELSIKDCLKYKKFVNNNLNYQKKLKIIKKIVFD